jgi:hypothetical protein
MCLDLWYIIRVHNAFDYSELKFVYYGCYYYLHGLFVLLIISVIVTGTVCLMILSAGGTT